MRHLFAILAFVLATVPVQGQLTDTNNTLWANFGEDYYIALAQEADGASGNVGITDETPQEQTMALVPPLTSGAELDASKTIDILACFDSSASLSGVPVFLTGTLSVTTEVRQGGTIIATGEAQDVPLLPSMMAKATWSLTPAVTSIQPGPLEWYLREGGAATGALFSPDCGDGDWSHVILPVKAANAPAPTDTASTSTSSAPASTTTASSSTSSTGPRLEPLPDTTTSDDNTATGGFPLQEDKDTPSSGFAAVLATLALVAFAVRRRLA